MAYSTTVDIVNLEGGNYPSLTARLWMLWTVIGSGSNAGPQQQPQEDLTIQTTSDKTILSFNQGPDNSYALRQIGLSIQDSNRVDSETGWWFRSGRMETLPQEPIEVVLVNGVQMTQSEIDAALPPMPLQVDSATTVDSVNVALQDDGFISLTANGTTSAPPLTGPVNFTYSLLFKIVPSASIANAETEVFEIETQGRGTIAFTSSTVTGTIQAAILNTLSFFILREVFPRFRTRLKDGLNASVLSQLAGRIAPGTTTLPAGIIVSARSVSIRSQGISVRAALGAYGGVLSKFPSINPGNSKSCGLSTLSASTPDTMKMELLRMFRDNVLAGSSGGRELIGLYYKHSQELVEILLSSNNYSATAIDLILELQQRIGSREYLTPNLLDRCMRLLRAIEEKGSDELRHGIKTAIKVAEKNNYFGMVAVDV